MKLTYKNIEAFVKAPDPKARAILLYGPDHGLMKQRAALIGRSIVDDLNDPFNVTTLTMSLIIEDPARLADEANAISMMGGHRLIRIEDANEKLASPLKAYLENPSPDNVILLEAGELSTSSTLRKLCEASKAAAALPCYIDDEKSLLQIIRTHLTSLGYTIQSDALQWLAHNINGDRQQVINELNKLAIYIGDPPLNSKPNITIEDAQACCGQSGAHSFDDLTYNVAGANPYEALKAYSCLLEEGIPAISLLRALQSHFMRLHYTKTLLESGITLDQAMNKLSPPVFFKQSPAFKNQVLRWPASGLRQVIERLSQLESLGKKTGYPIETMCGQALLSISRK